MAGSIRLSQRLCLLLLRRSPLSKPLRPFTRTFSHKVSEPNELFEYTSGRWIYNEAQRYAARRRVFDVPELKRLAAESVNKRIQDVARFEKLAEGGFNRSFLVTMSDGAQLIARIPYPTTGPKYLVVASEVATLDYLRVHGVPVPEVYGYSATADNAAGTEFIFMEYMSGRNLRDVWFDLHEEQCLTVMQSIVDIETRLFAIEFPASGSLFYTEDLRSTANAAFVPIVDAPSKGRFCVGPETTLRMWSGKRSNLDVDRGAYKTPEAVLAAVANKELAYLAQHGTPLHPLQPIHREFHNYQKQSHLDYTKVLQDYLRIAPYLVPKGFEFLSAPTIRHPDLQPSNILVSADLNVTGLIDWQHCSVLPLFLQCGIPNSIQNYGDTVSESMHTPALPDDFPDLDANNQSEQLEILRRRHIHYYYSLCTGLRNPLHAIALTHSLSILRRKLYTHASYPWEGDIVSLKADLVHLTQNWEKLSSPTDAQDPCPISYPEDEASKCLDLNAQQIEADEQMQIFRNYIGIGSDGWLPSHNYDASKQREMELKELALKAAESDEERIKLSENWIFRDFDEEEYA